MFGPNLAQFKLCQAIYRPTYFQIGQEGSTQLVIPATTFGQVTDFDSTLVDTPLDGVLGLAFQSISINNVTPPLAKSIRQGLIAKPLFSVYLESGHGSAGIVTRGGVFTFGGMDTENCGQVIGWVPLIQATWWEFAVEEVRVGGSIIGREKTLAVSDTGTSLIIG